MYDQPVLYTIIITTVATVLIGIAQTLSSTLFNSLFETLKTIVQNFIDRKVYVLSIEQRISFTKNGWFNDTDQIYNGILIQSILWFVAEQQLYSRSGQLSIARATITADNIKTKYIQRFLPNDEIVYTRPDGHKFYISYNTTISNDKNAEHKTFKVTIKSKCTTTEIKNFIANECLYPYERLVENITNNTPKFYMQIPRNENLCFSKYDICNSTTFDDLFFPEKQRVMQLVDKVQTRKIDKLSILLHGLPGCGKSTIIKAISNATQRHVIHVKLCFIENDEMLIKVFHNNTIKCYKNNDTVEHNIEWDSIPLNQRIYIFEDFDADSDVTHNRKTIESKVIVLDKDKSFDTKLLNKHPLTLSGVLNALDGFMGLDGAILIFTTNHVEKIDPAVIRPGRMTLNLELGKMTSDDANLLIAKNFGRELPKFPDKVFTPAEICGFCTISNSFTDFSELIATEYKKKSTFA